MTDQMTLAEIAREFGVQPYEVAAFLGWGDYSDDNPLTTSQEMMLREAWDHTLDDEWDAQEWDDYGYGDDGFTDTYDPYLEDD